MVIWRVLQAEEFSKDLLGILRDVMAVLDNTSLSSKSRDELSTQLVQEDLIIRVADPEEIDDLLKVLANTTDATDDLEPGAHVDRHLTAYDAMATDVEIQRLRPEFGVEEQNLDLGIVIEIMQVFGPLFLGMRAAERDHLESEVDQLSLDVPMMMLAGST